MQQNNRKTATGAFTSTYIISPSAAGQRVSVRRYPSSNSAVLAYLTSDTVVQVVSKTSYWLYIVLPDKVQGYIYSTYARPATNSELAAIRKGKFPAAPTEKRRSHRTSVRFPGGIASFFVKGWVSLSLFLLSFLLFAFGLNVGREVGDCTIASGSTCAYPYESLGALILVIAFFVLLYAVVSLVITLAKVFHAHRIK